jgi:hypothetical protein
MRMMFLDAFQDAEQGAGGVGKISNRPVGEGAFFDGEGHEGSVLGYSDLFICNW